MKLATTGREKGLQPPNPERRRWLTHIGGIAVVGLLPTVTQGAVPLRPTPMQSAGPFYPETLPADSDNDLVKVHGQEDYAGGEMTELRGQVVDIAGHPVIGARIEIWQCDANGRYHHPRDRGHAPATPASRATVVTSPTSMAASASAPSARCLTRGAHRIFTSPSTVPVSSAHW